MNISRFNLLLLVLISTVFACQTKEKGKDLFEEYFQPIPLIHLPEALPDTEEWQKVTASYKAEDFQEVLRQLQKMELSTENEKISAAILEANCILAGKQNAEKAIAVISKIYKGPVEYHGIANWYLGLAYLKNGRKEEARRVVWEIFKREGEYQQARARELIDDLLINMNDVNNPK